MKIHDKLFLTGVAVVAVVGYALWASTGICSRSSQSTEQTIEPRHGVILPSTPAGHELAAWLDVLEHGTRAELSAFNARFSRELREAFPIEAQMEVADWLWERATGVDLLEIRASTPDEIFVRGRTRDTDESVFIRMEVDEGSERRITVLSVSSGVHHVGTPDSRGHDVGDGLWTLRALFMAAM